MPIKSCSSSKEGKKYPGFKYGDSGTCYIYEPGNESSRSAAREKARKQGVAIKISQEDKNYER